MTLADCPHENVTNDQTGSLHFDGDVYDDFEDHTICLDCQQHIDCTFTCAEHKKYLRMKGEIEEEFPF
jgi:hypothetical protein